MSSYKRVVSASQYTTFLSCPRKWWLQSVYRMPRTEELKFNFGTVMHSVIERFMLADMSGRDKGEEAVDLFPEGWEVAEDRFGSKDGSKHQPLTPVDQSTIKALIHQAIEAGILVRHPGRKVEAEYRLPLSEEIDFLGYIDLCYDNVIEDHKSTSDMRWAKNAIQLANDPQMLLCAAVRLMELDEQGITPDHMVLKHNQFCKNPNKLKVKQTIATVKSEFVMEYWDSFVKVVLEQMLPLTRQTDHNKLDNAKQDNPPGCEEYGGCAFKSICYSNQSPDAFAQVMSNSIEYARALKASASKDKGDKPVGLSDLIAARKKALNNQGPSAPKEEKAPEPTAEAPAEGQAAAGDSPPWANAECKACLGTGFNSVGRPCQVCDIRAAKAGKPTSRVYDIVTQEDGSYSWTEKQSKAPDPAKAPEPKPEPAKAPEPAPAPAPKPKAGKAPAPDVDEARPVDKNVSDQAITADGQAKAKGEFVFHPTAGRIQVSDHGFGVAADNTEDRGIYSISECYSKPQKAAATRKAASRDAGTGFVLAINCVPKTAKDVLYIEDVMKVLGDEMAEDAKVESYYMVDVFKRRDFLSARAPAFVADLAHGTVICAMGVGSGASDTKTLVDALRPLASEVFSAMAG